MTKKALLSAILIIIISASVVIFVLQDTKTSKSQKSKSDPSIAVSTAQTSQPTGTPSTPIKATPVIPKAKTISSLGHVFQTYNNCGPATYSMVLQYSGVKKSQKELGDILRPHQLPRGDNDDKSVSMEEIAAHAQTLGLASFHRPNGTIEKIKQFIAADQPVVLRTWLNSKEDIGHFIIIRGYDDESQTIIFDDSYYNPNRTTTYESLESIWQPFNYEYLIVTKNENVATINSILRDETDMQQAWQNALTRSNQEHQLDTSNIYPQFNSARANYYLGNYDKTIQTYEQIKSRLPFRMLWYQYEPILAYQKTKNYQQVFVLTTAILNSENRGFSELYYIRALAYLDQGNKELAKQELDLAIKYNLNYQAAINLRQTL